MSSRPSFRSQLAIGSVLWTVGLLCVVSVAGVAFLAHNPRPHAVLLNWFMAIPAGLALAAGAAGMIAGFVKIRRSLSMIDGLRTRVASIQRGETRRLNGAYPAEVQPLVDGLNALVEEREARVQRAVARAGDLAHGLKTPLSVLSRDAERIASRGNAEMAASLNTQIERMRRQIDYHLAHARASASARIGSSRTSVAASADGLQRALERVHADRAIDFELQIPAALTVACQREDLDEMLGNLLDNACKWCRTRVCVGSQADGPLVVICVDDDGGGIDPSLLPAVLNRGFRADERTPGSGLGLAIVHDLAELYEGSITLARSPLGGLRAELRLPTANRP